MKALILSLIVLGFASNGFAIEDSSRCNAAKRIASQLADSYIADDVSCEHDTDCSEVAHIGRFSCGGGRLVNKVGAAGHKLLLESAEYKRLAQIVTRAQATNACGPQPMCAQRPPGKLVCLENQCFFQFDQR